MKKLRKMLKQTLREFAITEKIPVFSIAVFWTFTLTKGFAGFPLPEGDDDAPGPEGAEEIKHFFLEE